ncbi:hypothetical protein EDD15DRAFT_2468849 [Pisolithus albus]|nr:hypothetical protein EDD15DRAFT_2468849 [Pisolithus albus]
MPQQVAHATVMTLDSITELQDDVSSLTMEIVRCFVQDVVLRPRICTCALARRHQRIVVNASLCVDLEAMRSVSDSSGEHSKNPNVDYGWALQRESYAWVVGYLDDGSYKTSGGIVVDLSGALFGAHRRINLAKATSQELGKLEVACQPATFGVNIENVYGRTYRKAGKMDSADFATSFDAEDSNLLNILDQGLLEGNDEERVIKLEFYKLKRLRKRLVFQGAQGYPQSETMSGSLITVSPNSDECAEFILCDREHEWEVNLAKLIPESSRQPCVSHVAFFAHVEHEDPW